MARKIVLPVLFTFIAGLFGGMLFERHLAPPLAGPLPADLVAYANSMQQVASLGDSQVEDLRILLRYYDDERNRLLQAQRKLIEPELSDLDQRFESLIQNRILRPDQREVFVRMEATPPTR